MIRSQGARWAGLFATSAVCLALAPAAFAQTQGDQAAETPVLDDEGYEVEELVVTATRGLVPRGSVVGDAVPEITLDQREIRALGVSSVEELLAALEPQLASGRGRAGGRPVMLVNGMRISSFREIRDLPPEAIVRMEILPEEVALRYGYRADQRVVNLVLRRRFRAVTVEGEVVAPTAGGRSAYELDLDALRIQDDARQQFEFEATYATRLLESERDIVRTPDEGPFRTLSPQTQGLSLNGVYARPFGEGMSGTLNGSLEWNESNALLGLSGGAERDALGRLSDTSAAHLGGAVNGAWSGWRWSVTGNADVSRSRTLTEVAVDPATGAWRPANSARSTVTSADLEALANGTLLTLPAGPVNAAFTVGGDTRRLESESDRFGVRRDSDLSRHIARAQANLDVPLASRRRGGFEGVGDLSVNFNAAVDRLSDFGTLTTLGGGVTWSPVEAVRLIASVTEEEGAPSVQQLGDPETATPGVRVFDFTRGETVEVLQLSGGNRGLLADNRRVVKLGLTLKPFDETDFTIRADYTRTRTRDEIASFPAPTPQIEAAFQDRFVRDATGRLVQVDVRPVNFDRHDEEQLRWGFHYSRPLQNTRTPAGAPGTQRRAEGAGPSGGGPPGGFRGGRGRFSGGNMTFAVFHTWRIEDEVLIRPGVPVLDLLDGAALSQSGGASRHQVDVQAGVSKNGLGARLNARWREGSRVDGGPSGESLRFSDLTTVDLRLFADLGLQPMAREHTWMRGARVSLEVKNLFDERIAVRDEAGLTPLSYQPDLIDPVGRTVSISFRKLFLPPRPVRPVQTPTAPTPGS